MIIVASFVVLVSLVGYTILGIEVDCFTQVLRSSQACTNTDVLHVGTMGGGSGLGSEFLAYYIKSLMSAVSLNKRMVYLKSGRKWEYDCPSKAGWACYFDIGSQCPDSIVDYSAVKDNSTVLLHANLIQHDQGTIHTIHTLPPILFATLSA